MHIGNIIKGVLAEKRILVSEFAKMANSDRANMYRLERRPGNVPLESYRYFRCQGVSQLLIFGTAFQGVV